jgi:hypothetical protein
LTVFHDPGKVGCVAQIAEFPRKRSVCKSTDF